MIDFDDDDVNLDEAAAFPKEIAADSRALPIHLMREAFGPALSKVTNSKGICVVIATKQAWIKPLAGAVKSLAHFDAVYDGSATPRLREDQERSALEKLTKGGRVVCIGVRGTDTLPTRLLGAADVAVDIDRLTVKPVALAIQTVTKIKPKGLAQEDVEGIELGDAMIAIRAQTSATSCVRRLRATRQMPHPDPLVSEATPVEELAGYGEARVWAEGLIADLNRWRASELDFGAIQRNLVLAGAPGVGKSAFVRSLARSTGLPLITTSIGQMFASSPGYLDSIVKAIDAVFARARAAGPAAILFMDEIEAVPNRATLEGRGSDWWTPVINHLLTSLDSAMSTDNNQLIVIGATNHPEKLDAALVRPGRLDRIVWIPEPAAEDLVQIFRQHLDGDLAGEDLTALGEMALGSTGAAVVGFIKTARAAARASGEPLSMEHLKKAVCPPSSLTPANQRRAAIHEAGHAVIAIVAGGHRVRAVVMGGDQAGGRVVFERPPDGVATQDQRDVEVVQLLAGRAAEQHCLGAASTGSGGADHSDLARATRIVAASRLSYGLKGELTYLGDPDAAIEFVRFKPPLLRMIEDELQQHNRTALNLVAAHEHTIIEVAEALLTKGAMSGDEIRAIVATAQKMERRRVGS